MTVVARAAAIDPLLELFAQCVVRINIDGAFAGTGFYVAPDEVLTCAHVVHGGESITVGDNWAAEPTTPLLPSNDAQARKFYPQPDAVLLHVPDAPAGHPCVRLVNQAPAVDDQLQLTAWVKNEHAPAAVARSGACLRMETTFVQDGWTLYKLRDGQIIKGFSGGPVLHRRTGDVCALVDATRAERSDLGGFGVPVDAIATLDAGLLARNAAFHDTDRRWTDAVEEQRVAEDDRAVKPRLPAVALPAEPTVAPRDVLQVHARLLRTLTVAATSLVALTAVILAFSFGVSISVGPEQPNESRSTLRAMPTASLSASAVPTSSSFPVPTTTTKRFSDSSKKTATNGAKFYESEPATYEVSKSWSLAYPGGRPQVMPRMEDDVVEVTCRGNDQMIRYEVNDARLVGGEWPRTDGTGIQIQPGGTGKLATLTITVICQRP